MAPTAGTPASMRIDLYSHGIKVSNYNHRARSVLLGYARGMAEWGKVRISPTETQYQMIRVYAGANRDKSVLHFHRNQFEELMRCIGAAGIPRETIELVVHPMYEPVKVEFKMKDERPAHGYQVPIIDYLAGPCQPGTAPSKVVTLQTGKGKSFIALHACRIIGERVFMVIKGMYVEKWKEDVQSAYHLNKGDLMVVRGAEHLAGLIQLAKDNELKAKWIICTVKTMYNYIKAYEHDLFIEQEMYALDPTEFYKTIGAGVRLIDEVHQEFHLNFRQDLYSNVPRTISLSATLDSDSQFLNQMYDICWPRATRAPEVEYDKFIAVLGLQYGFRDIKKIRCKNFMKQYSHVIFEESIMRNPTMWENYLGMLARICYTEFISKPDRVGWDEATAAGDSKKGQSYLIICATTKMCSSLQKYLKELYPTLMVNRYCPTEGDNYEKDFLTGDIIVSTIQSSGTAVDRINLRSTLMTVALSSKQSNIQVLGRTRKLRDYPEIAPTFVFLSCRQLDKHMQYQEDKRHKLAGKVKSFGVVETDFLL